MPILPFASMQPSARSRTARLPNTATTNQHWPESVYPASVEPCIARISPFTWNEADQNTSDVPELNLARLLHSLEPNASLQTTRLLNDCAGLLGSLWDDKIWITEAATEALNRLLTARQHSNNLQATQHNPANLTELPDSIQASYYLSVDLNHVMQPVATPHLQLITQNKQQNQLSQYLTHLNSPLHAQKVQLWDVQGKGRALHWVVAIEA